MAILQRDFDVSFDFLLLSAHREVIGKELKTKQMIIRKKILPILHGPVISVGPKKNRLLQPKAQEEVAAELSQTLPGE